MTRTPFHFAQIIAFCAPLALVTSCGKGTEAVQGTTIVWNPASWGQATTLGVSGAAYKQLRVAVISPTGYPQVGAAVHITSPYFFFDGWVDPPFTGLTPLTTLDTTTDNSGAHAVTVVYDWGPAISGTFTAMEAWSGTAYNHADIDFTCTDPDPANPPACP